jgi:hypothetical protein
MLSSEQEGLYKFRLTSLDLALLAIALGLATLSFCLVVSDYEPQREFFGGFVELLIGPPELRRYDQVEPGMTQSEVRELLGEATKVCTAGATCEQYGLTIEHRRERPTGAAPAGGVWTYANHNWTAGCYVFFNETGRVEEVAVVAWD